MKIAVTGVGGFVGGATANHLAEHGHEVLGISRSRGSWSGPFVAWDITTPAPSLTECEAVVHCAALADDWASRSRAFAVNVEGSRAVRRAFARARFVHVSTSSVYDARVATVNATEAAPTGRFLSAYSESKFAAEAIFADSVILRPHAVYGPGDSTLLPRLLEAVRGSRLVLPEGARVLHSLTRIDNLVEAIELGLGARAGIYNVADAHPVSLADVLRELLDRKGREDVALTSIPYRVAFGAAAVLERVHSVVGGRPRTTRYAVSQLGLERTLDLSAARAGLGFSPRESSLDGAEAW